MVFSSIVFLTIDFKNYLTEEEEKEKFHNKIKIYSNYLDKIKIKKLIIILKNNNINNQDKIKLMISHYNKKIPIKIEAGFGVLF